MKRFPELYNNLDVYLIRNLEFHAVKVVDKGYDSTSGDSEITIAHKGLFGGKQEIVKRSLLISTDDIRELERSRTSNNIDDTANKIFDSAVKTTEGVINSTADYAGKLRDNFVKFKDQVITDELLEEMRKEAECTFDPVVAKEKIDTASEVLSGAVKNMHDKMFGNDKKD